MQLVIDIDEKTIDAINHEDFFINLGRSNGKTILCNIINAIKTATPLPKGHGRLGDLDALEKEMVNGIHAGNYEKGYETFAHINNMDDCVDCVRYADTIIEADKEKNNDI